MTVEEIYQVFGQHIVDNVPGDYVQAFARFERQGGGIPTGGGYYMRPNGFVGSYTYTLDNDRDRQAMRALEELWQTTHATGHYHWTVLYAGLRPGGKFDVEFALEDRPAQPGYVDRLLRAVSPNRKPALSAQAMQHLLARVPVLTTAVSAGIAHTLTAAEMPWEKAVLELTKSSAGQFQVSAKVAQPQLVPSDDEEPSWMAIDVTTRYTLFRNLVELSTTPGLGNWDQAVVRVYADGRYALTFDKNHPSDKAAARSGNQSPVGAFPLHRQGRWIE